MSMSDDRVKGWQQLPLFSGGVTELILRVGAFPDADHAQFQLEARVASTHELLALHSRPHVAWRDAGAELERWLDELREMLRELDQPFPG